VLIFPLIAGFYSLVATVNFFRRRSYKFFKNVAATFIILLFILYPIILRKSFELLSCMTVDDSTNLQVLVTNPSIECWGDDHNAYVYYIAIPSIGVWGLGSPLVFYLLLKICERKVKENIRCMASDHEVTRMPGLRKSIKKTLIETSKEAFKTQSSKLHQILNFLYRGYKEERYFWEICIFFRKFVMTMVTVFTQFLNRQTKSAMLILMLIFWMEINFKYRPYLNRVLNLLEGAGLLFSFLVVNMGILMWSYPEWGLGLAIFIVICNLFYMVCWSFAVVCYFYEKGTRVTKFMNQIFGKNRFQKSLLLYLFSASEKNLFYEIVSNLIGFLLN
jgi:hypothetical protein